VVIGGSLVMVCGTDMETESQAVAKVGDGEGAAISMMPRDAAVSGLHTRHSIPRRSMQTSECARTGTDCRTRGCRDR